MRSIVRKVPVLNLILYVMFHSVRKRPISNKIPNNFEQCKATCPDRGKNLIIEPQLRKGHPAADGYQLLAVGV